MADRNIKVNLDIDAQGAEQALGDVADEADKLNKDLSQDLKLDVDVTPGEQAVADLRAQIQDAKDAVEKIELGVDASAAEQVLGQVKGDTDALSKQKVEIPVTVDEAAIGKAEAGLKGVADGAERVKKEAPSSAGALRDVSGALGNVGGGVLDAGEGLMGLGETLGSLGPKFEGVASALGSLGFIGAGVGLGITVAVTAIQKFGEAAKKAREESHKFFVDLVKDAGDVKKTLGDFITQDVLQKSDGLTKGIDALGLGMQDLTAAAQGQMNPALQQAVGVLQDVNHWGSLGHGVQEELAQKYGLTADQVKILWENSSQLLGVLTGTDATVKSATSTYDAYSNILAKGTANSDSFSAAAVDATQAIFQTGQAAYDATAAIQKQTDMKAAEDELTGALKRQADQFQEVEGIINDVTDAINRATGTQIDLNREMRDVGDAIKAAAKAKKGTDDQTKANEDLFLAVTKVADAAKQNAQVQADATGKTLTAKDAVAAQVRQLEILKLTYPQLGPIIDGHIAKLKAVPDDVTTFLNANAEKGGEAVDGWQHTLTTKVPTDKTTNIHADTSSAATQVDAFARRVESQRVRLPVDVVVTVAGGQTLPKAVQDALNTNARRNGGGPTG